MMIKNVTRRASKAMYELSRAHDELTPFIHKVNSDDLEDLLNAIHLINEAQIELVKILAQDNEVEIED